MGTNSDTFWPNYSEIFINLAKLGKLLAKLAKISAIFKQKIEL